jgi:iron-sulfur cluster repair protein YtfE (RIC family)
MAALRALGPGRQRWPRLRGDDAELVRRLGEEHRKLWPRIVWLPNLAEQLTQLGPSPRRAALDELGRFLDDLAAHEDKDERLLYPVVARVLGGSDPTGAMSRGHAEILELTRRTRLLAEQARRDRPPGEVPRELRGALHELYAVLRLHFAQEEESYFVLADTATGIEIDGYR